MTSKKTLLNAVAPLALTTLIIATMPSDAHALCVAQDMEGTWRNANKLTPLVTHITITFDCNDQVLNGVSTDDPDTVHVWERCFINFSGGNECYRGSHAIGYKFWSEAADQYTHVRAATSNGSNSVQRTLRIFLLDDGRLWVFMEVRYNDSALNNFSVGEYFIR